MVASNLTEKCIKNAKELAISDQLFQCDSLITLDDFDIFVSDSNNFKLLLYGNLLVKCDKPFLNKTTKSFPLDLFD